MRCIFCAEDGLVLTDEHVVPESLGAPFIIRTVCKPCNDWLGHEVDVLLTESFIIQNIRLGLRLPSKSGAIPSPLKNGQLLDNEPLTASYSRSIGDPKGVVKVVPQVQRIHEDGRDVVHVGGESAEVAQIIRTLQERAARDGKGTVVRHESRRLVKGPVVEKKTAENLLDLLRPMSKIVYELATHWLGELYVDDPEAASLRSIVAGHAVAVEAQFGYFVPLSHFREWQVPSYFHLAALQAAAPVVTIAVRLFGVAEARVVVTDHSIDYPDATDHWLAIDPVSRTYVEGIGSAPPAPLTGHNVDVVVQDEGDSFTIRVFYEGIEETITRVSLGA